MESQAIFLAKMFSIELPPSLVDADDPLLADTTKITFDVAAAEEEATVAAAVLTPASEDRALLAVSATQRLGAVGAGSKRSVQLFVQVQSWESGREGSCFWLQKLHFLGHLRTDLAKNFVWDL